MEPIITLKNFRDDVAVARDCNKPTRHRPGGAEGFFTEAALCLLYIGLDVWLVLIVVSLLIALVEYRKRKYKPRKS